LLSEANELADQAVQRAPEESAAHLGRARVEVGARLTEVLLRRPPREELKQKLVRMMFSEAVFPDLRTATRLDPDNPRVAAIAVWTELLAHSVAQNGVAGVNFLSQLNWERLPEELRQFVRQTLTRMERVSEGSNRLRASRAWELCGSLQLFVMQNDRAGEAAFRRAVEADPRNEAAWEKLILTLVRAGRFTDMARASQDRLKGSDTPRNRVILAKAYDRDGRSAEARHVLEDARRRYPTDPLVCLGLCAVIMRDPETSAVPTAAALLQTAAQHLGKRSSLELVRNLVFQEGVFLALAGRVEQARSAFEKLRHFDPENERVQTALKLLDQMPATGS